MIKEKVINNPKLLEGSSSQAPNQAPYWDINLIFLLEIGPIYNTLGLTL